MATHKARFFRLRACPCCRTPDLIAQALPCIAFALMYADGGHEGTNRLAALKLTVLSALAMLHTALRHIKVRPCQLDLLSAHGMPAATRLSIPAQPTSASSDTHYKQLCLQGLPHCCRRLEMKSQTCLALMR